jgi:hypothetical protein
MNNSSTKVLSVDDKNGFAKSYPFSDRWTYRKVKVIPLPKNTWYHPGQVLKVKYFGTFGCYDYKDRWVDYYHIGKELRPNLWTKFLFFITKFI